MADNSLVLTVDEAAKLARTGRQTLYDACYRGELRHFNVSRYIRIPREALDEWIKLQCDKTEERMRPKVTSMKRRAK